MVPTLTRALSAALVRDNAIDLGEIDDIGEARRGQAGRLVAGDAHRSKDGGPVAAQSRAVRPLEGVAERQRVRNTVQQSREGDLGIDRNGVRAPVGEDIDRTIGDKLALRYTVDGDHVGSWAAAEIDLNGVIAGCAAHDQRGFARVERIGFHGHSSDCHRTGNLAACPAGLVGRGDTDLVGAWGGVNVAQRHATKPLEALQPGPVTPIALVGETTVRLRERWGQSGSDHRRDELARNPRGRPADRCRGRAIDVDLPEPEIVNRALSRVAG